MTKLCICKICNCGRHRCPHNPPAKGGMCTLTEYHTRYHPHPIDVRTSFKPAQDLKQSEGVMDDKTTHRLDYTKHPMEKPFVREADVYVKPDGHFEGLTSYNKDFVPKRGERAQGAMKEYTRKEPGKFDGLPTYTSDYRKWDLKPRGLAQSQPAWSAPKGQFVGDTNYRDDYVRYGVAPRQSFKPAEVAKRSDAAIDDQTMYRKAYVAFDITRREPKPRPEWNPNKTPLDGLTTFRRDFTPKQGPVADSCKPNRDAYASDAPFVDDTTMRNDYKKWALERPYQHMGAVYTPPKGQMDMHTTHKLNYTQKPLERVTMKRPPSRQRLTAAFVGNPTYRDDYRKWDLGMREPVTAKDCYVAPKANFEGIPTYKAHYIPHSLQPSRSYKPDAQQMKTGEFSDDTSYRIEYVEKQILPCPAANIDANPNFMMTNQDPTGHKFYALNPTTMTPAVTQQAMCA